MLCIMVEFGRLDILLVSARVFLLEDAAVLGAFLVLRENKGWSKVGGGEKLRQLLSSW